MSNIKRISRDEFPPLLQEITDPPQFLYVKGDVPDQTENIYLSVVGSRKNSSYGKDVCERLIEGLSGYPIVIVSGLALGIDSIAHEVALQAKLKTIAIPGSGLGDSVLYPANHLKLARRIVEEGGALISEFEENFRATPYSFPQRNRIMAGISKATLVIEAEQKSGTLITARLALDYNRDVFAVPGSIFSKTSEGSHYLIRNGATPVTKSRDLIEALGFSVEEDISKSTIDCSPEEKKVLEILREPLSKDELLRKSSFSTQALNAIISMLEIKGLVKEEVGEIRRI